MPEIDAAGREQLELAIAAQEQLRGVVPDSVVDASVAALRQQLDAMQTTTQRRRQVTILFADVSGFTAMSDRLDAEQVAQTMNSLWVTLDSVIRLHGGRIDKHIGDAVMAMWGSDAAREDDPEQALRAALGLQEELVRFRAVHGLDLQMRVGVNTGPVLLGNVASTTEFTAMGDAVNVASRLEHASPLGGVLISHDTYRHVRGVFDVEELEPVVLRGKTESIRVYVVQRAKARAFRVASRGVEGVETKTVGRGRELAALCSAYEECTLAAGVRLACVVGDAGIGKSRLLYEFRNWIELRREQVFLFTGRALLGQDRQVLGLMRDVLATRFDVMLSDPPPVVAGKLRAGLAPALTDDEAEVVGHWLGFEIGDSGAVNRLAGSTEFANVARAHLFAWLAALTGEQPGVLLFEDLHWADQETLELIELLAHRRDMHLLVVALARPALYEQHPGWAPTAERIELGALTAHACRELVAEVLQHADAVPDELVELIVGRADGNPFYVEELVKMLIDDDVIAVGDVGEQWHIELDRLDLSSVPATLTGVLQARLDGLPEGERTSLQRASVVGRIFWDGAVTALGDGDRSSTASALDGARRRELVHRRSPSAFAECAEFIFKHALLRDVTYETVLQRDRPGLHAAAAGWLETIAAERVAEYREVIAFHLERAGNIDGAARHLYEVGLAAASVGNLTAAMAALQRAIALWDSVGSAPEGAAFAALSRVECGIGHYDEADAVARRGLASPGVGPGDIAQLHYRRSVVASLRADRELERQELDSARAIVPPEAVATRSDIEMGTGWLCWLAGDHAIAVDYARHALELALSIGDSRRASGAEAILGMLRSEKGDYAGALMHAERELAYALESGDLQQIATGHGHLGVVHHLLGDRGEPSHHAQAATLYESQLRTLRRLGARQTESYAMLNLAQLRLRLGDEAATRQILADSVGSIDAEFTTMLRFQVEADRRITTGDLAGGLAILGRIRALPAYSGADEVETERILSRVVTPSDEITELIAAGADLDLDVVMEEIAKG